MTKSHVMKIHHAKSVIRITSACLLVYALNLIELSLAASDENSFFCNPIFLVDFQGDESTALNDKAGPPFTTPSSIGIGGEFHDHQRKVRAKSFTPDAVIQYDTDASGELARVGETTWFVCFRFSKELLEENGGASIIGRWPEWNQSGQHVLLLQLGPDNNGPALWFSENGEAKALRSWKKLPPNEWYGFFARFRPATESDLGEIVMNIYAMDTGTPLITIREVVQEKTLPDARQSFNIGSPISIAIGMEYSFIAVWDRFLSNEDCDQLVDQLKL